MGTHWRQNSQAWGMLDPRRPPPDASIPVLVITRARSRASQPGHRPKPVKPPGPPERDQTRLKHVYSRASVSGPKVISLTPEMSPGCLAPRMQGVKPSRIHRERSPAPSQLLKLKDPHNKVRRDSHFKPLIKPWVSPQRESSAD